MPKESKLREGEEAVVRFRCMVKKVVSVPKDEINRRAKGWREARESDKSETSDE